MKDLKMVQIPISELKLADYNPRKWNEKQMDDLMESIKKFKQVDPLIVNQFPGREMIIVGGHMRLEALKKLGYKTAKVVFVNLPLEKERELNIRLNKNTGEFDWDLLSNFSEGVLSDIGFSSDDLDKVFDWDEDPEVFDLEKELQKLNIKNINFKKGDVYKLGDHKLMCGDSTIEEDVLKLMNGEKADMSFTDPPYLLSYLTGKKRHGKATEGFGLKRDRRYLETDVLPPDFTEKWMKNVAKVQKTDFSIIVFENPKNLRTIWNELEKHWRYRNTIVWHLPNRVQGFAAKYKFFNKHDIALVATDGKVSLNTNQEEDLLQNEYENALYATSGSPHWESYEKGKKYCPTDYIDYKAADEKSTGQGIIFGTKPIEILIPYIKVLTKRGDLILEPFGGSGSTMIAAEKLNRRCFVMEKSPVYCEVIRNRWEKLTGKKAVKIYGN